MTSRPAGRRQGVLQRTEDGASLVEFALVTPLLILLLLGVIDFGLIYNNYQSLRQGVRTAGRDGAVAQFGTSTSCGLTFAGGGSTPSDDIKELMCQAKSQIGLGSSTRVKVIFVNTAVTPWAEASSAFAVNNGLTVCAATPLTSTSGFFTSLFTNKYLTTKTTFRIEQVTDSTGTLLPTETDGYETPPTGSNWNWCTATSSAP